MEWAYAVVTLALNLASSAVCVWCVSQCRSLSAKRYASSSSVAELVNDIADLESRYASILASVRRQNGRLRATPIDEPDSRPWKERARSVVASNVAAKRPAAIGVPKE